jgi:hypothetical protein
MAQVQQIYARLFSHIDVATSLLLKQDLVDAEFVREQNQRIFTKLNAIQDAALMQSSSQVPIQFLHTEDMSNGPSLGDNDDYGSISRRSSLCISTKSLPLDGSGYPSDGSTPVLQILLTHRHMRRAIKILLMIQLCVCALNPFLCRTHLSTEYQGGFLLISNTPHDMNRT